MRGAGTILVLMGTVTFGCGSSSPLREPSDSPVIRWLIPLPDFSDVHPEIRADGEGNIYQLGYCNMGFTGYVPSSPPTVEKRDASGALLWTTTLERGCYGYHLTLGATDDGRFGVDRARCDPSRSIPIIGSTVTLLNRSGSVDSEFAVGIPLGPLAINRFAEVYAYAGDADEPMVLTAWGDYAPAGTPAFRLIGPDGSDLWVVRDGSLVPNMYSVQPAPDGGAVGVTQDGSAAFRVARDGTVLWRKDLPAPPADGYLSTALLRDGSFVIAVETMGVVKFGSGSVGVDGQRGRALLVVASDGRPRAVIPVPKSPSPGVPGASVIPVALSDGGVAAWEFGSCPRIWAFSSDLSLRWERSLDDSCGPQTGYSRIDSAVATQEGIVLTGRGSGRFVQGSMEYWSRPYLMLLQP